MALNYTTLFDRIGKGVFLLNLVNEFYGSVVINSAALATDLPTEVEDFAEQYDGTTPRMRGTIGDPNAKLNEAINGSSSIPSWVAQSLSNTLLVTLNDNDPLTSQTIDVALASLIANMVADSKTVDANAAAGSAAAGSGNIGTGKVVVSMKDGDGKYLEYSYAETMDMTFTSVSSAGAEAAKVMGAARVSMLAPAWPAGSAANKAITSVDALATGLVTNGIFEAWTGDVPNGWTVITGAAGISAEASVIYKGTKAVKITSNGVLLYELNQTLPVASLKAKTPYAINFFAKMASAPSTGILTVELFDGASTVLLDEAGVANSFTVALTTLGTSYVACNGAFRLCDPMPPTVVLRIKVSTAIENAKILYIDHLAMTPMTQLYLGGPYAAVFSGAVNWSLDDVFTITVTNDYGGALQTAFWRMFDMPSKGLVLPSHTSGGENILDTVIA